MEIGAEDFRREGRAAHGAGRRRVDQGIAEVEIHQRFERRGRQLDRERAGEIGGSHLEHGLRRPRRVRVGRLPMREHDPALGRPRHHTGLLRELRQHVLAGRLRRRARARAASRSRPPGAAASEGMRGSGTWPPAKKARAALSLRIGCRRVWRGPVSSRRTHRAERQHLVRQQLGSSCRCRRARSPARKSVRSKRCRRRSMSSVRRRVLEAQQQHVGARG